ncbi:MAG: PD-(D/E)XK nuclease family protein [Defluviitaleaceae bacterium]|nr:PD-(D/E)XK nuclease family protein [Defluviitaleaceae bacterium]
MPLNFILGQSGSGKTSRCIAEITGKLANENNTPMYYIVQEQATLQAERILVNATQQTTVIGAQALSFNRLAHHVFTRSGGVPTKQLDETGKHILLRKILQECELVFYAKAINMPGFIESLAETITELSEYEISVAELETRANRAAAAGNVNIASKLADLAVIYRKYKQNIRGRFLVADETLDLLVKALETSDYLNDTLFWIDGFKYFTPQELSVITKLLEIAQNVTIALPMDFPPKDGETLKLSDFFYTTKNTFATLKTIAANLGVAAPPPLVLNTTKRHQNKPEMLHLTTQFAKLQKPYLGETTSLQIIPLQDKWSELTQAAEWIQKQVKTPENGYKFSDIAILCGNLEGYEKLAKNVFETYEIPLFVDRKPSILLHPLTEFIRAALDIVVWDWQYESVFRLLKTGLTDIPTDEIDILENYVLARGIKRWRWRNRWRELNETRQKVLETLAPFLDDLKSDSILQVSEIAQRMYNWLYALNIPDKLATLLESASKEDGGDQEQALWHRQIWARIAEIFDKLVEILGEEPVTIKRFSEILEAGLKSEDLGLIPPTLDQIIMGDAKRSHYPEIKALLVLGANDGQLPPPIIKNTLITDDERETLRSFGLKLSPDIPQLTNESMITLHNMLCKPQEKLIFSYSRTNLDGKILRPAPVLARIKKILPNLQENPPKSAENPENEDNENIETDAIMQNLSEKSTETLYGETFLTSATYLENYAQCPFSYFLQYNLQAKEREIYKVKPTDLGKMYHEVLAQVVTHLTVNNSWETADKTVLEELVQIYAEKHIANEELGENPVNSENSENVENPENVENAEKVDIAENPKNITKTHVLYSNARNMYILQSIKNICTVSLWALCEQYRRGSFVVSSVEEKSHKLDMILDSAKKMVIEGRIDRVDTLALSENLSEKEYIKIIDYKSGKAKFSLDEVAAGRQLQLMLYMNTFLQNVEKNPEKNPDSPIIKPGGVFYFNIDDPIIKEDANLTAEERDEKLLQEFKMSGLVLADISNVSGIDKTLKAEDGKKLAGKSSIIPVNINKDGEFSKGSSIASLAEFVQLCDNVTAQIKQIGEKMSRGIISAKPSNNTSTKHCVYCKYKAICGHY